MESFERGYRLKAGKGSCHRIVHVPLCIRSKSLREILANGQIRARPMQVSRQCDDKVKKSRLWVPKKEKGLAEVCSHCITQMGVSTLLFHHLPLEAFWNGQTVDSKPSACLDTIRKKRRKKQRGKHTLSFLCWLPNQRDLLQHGCMDHLSPFGRPELIRASIKSYRRMREKLVEKSLIK